MSSKTRPWRRGPRWAVLACVLGAILPLRLGFAAGQRQTSRWFPHKAKSEASSSKSPTANKPSQKRTPAKWTLHSVDAKLGAAARLRSRNFAASLESGNIGRIERKGPSTFQVSLRSDNDDALPLFWRQWFYFELSDVPVDSPVTLNFGGSGHWNYYVPVYSYDNVNWTPFKEHEVIKIGRHEQKIVARFKKNKVWFARFQPYHYAHLNQYLTKISRRPDVRLDSLGLSPEGRSLPVLEIGMQGRDAAKKPHVVIHARTHPGEVGSSFLLEGFINFLVSQDPMARSMRRDLGFLIAPMLNVDGVVRGNNRTTPGGVNLEGKWATVAGKPLLLDPLKAPREVSLWHGRLMELRENNVRVNVALNLHASNGEPSDQVFFFPHFGPRALGYTAAEAELFGRQTSFIEQWQAAQGAAWFNQPARDGGRSFLAKNCPETWWWRNFGADVMALSIESTYGRAGPHRRWMTPDDMRQLGRSMAIALGRFHRLDKETRKKTPEVASLP